jgi:hypothetical protein
MVLIPVGCLSLDPEGIIFWLLFSHVMSALVYLTSGNSSVSVELPFSTYSLWTKPVGLANKLFLGCSIIGYFLVAPRGPEGPPSRQV